MARAFIASVPMGIVLVAALVVPLAVIPGTFGFDRWPSARRERVTERQVRIAPPKVVVVKVNPRLTPAPAPRRTIAVASVAARPAPAAPPVAPAPRRVLVVVRAPSQRDPRPHQAPAHQAPPQTPAAPAQPQQPSKNDSGLLANGTPPVARELPPQAPPPAQPTPAPVPAPVQQAVPAPVERFVPSEPCNGNGHGHGGGGQHGDGDSQE
jgi:hypothetical protein